MHNSNLKQRQITLSGEKISEERFYVLGFVSAGVIGLKKEVWFCKLNSEQISKSRTGTRQTLFKSCIEFLCTHTNGERLVYAWYSYTMRNIQTKAIGE